VSRLEHLKYFSAITWHSMYSQALVMRIPSPCLCLELRAAQRPMKPSHQQLTCKLTAPREKPSEYPTLIGLLGQSPGGGPRWTVSAHLLARPPRPTSLTASAAAPKLSEPIK